MWDFVLLALGDQGPIPETNYSSLLFQRRPGKAILLHFTFRRGLVDQFFFFPGPVKAWYKHFFFIMGLEKACQSNSSSFSFQRKPGRAILHFLFEIAWVKDFFSIFIFF